jgi:antitoxin component of MazEF toxin-antitoxin module
MAKIKVVRIGNSFGLILPRNLLEMLGVKAGDYLEVSAKRYKLTIDLEKQISLI